MKEVAGGVSDTTRDEGDQRRIWRTRCSELFNRVERLESALRSMRKLAAVAHDGDPWYAEQAGIDVDAIFDEARVALEEKP